MPFPKVGGDKEIKNIIGSKSITNRILIILALLQPEKPIEIKNFLFSEDTEIMLNALVKIGTLKIIEQNKKE